MYINLIKGMTKMKLSNLLDNELIYLIEEILYLYVKGVFKENVTEWDLLLKEYWAHESTYKDI